VDAYPTENSLERR